MDDRVFDIELMNMMKDNKTGIPQVVSDRIGKTLASLEDKEITKKKVKFRFAVPKKLKQAGIAAAIALIGLTVSAVVSPSVANAVTDMPVIGSVFKLFGDMGLKLASDRGVSSFVAQTKRDKNIRFTIKDILYDGSRLSIGYTMEGDSIGELGRPDLLIDGKEFNCSTSGQGSLVAKNCYAGILNINPTSELPKSFKLSVYVNKIGTVEGKWEFKNIEVKSTANKLNAKVITPMITKPLGDGSITIDKIYISDSTIKVYITRCNIPGNKYTYQLSDNYGKVLVSMGWSGGGYDNIENMECTFIPSKNKPEYLVLRLLENKIEKPETAKEVKVDFTGNLPVTISQGQGGEISVNKIEYLNDKTLVHYTYKGNDPDRNSHVFWVEDEAGNNLKNYAKSIVRNEDDSYTLECEPIDKNKKIKIVTMELPNIQSEIEFKIPIR